MISTDGDNHDEVAQRPGGGGRIGGHRAAQTGAQSATPYKLGMFEQGGRTFVGMVINNDTTVIDLSRANVSAPATLKQLIAGWDGGTWARGLAALAASSAAKPPAFAMQVAEVKTLPPIPDPACC